MERMIEHIRKKMTKRAYVTDLPREGCFVIPEKRIELKKVELGPNIRAEKGKSPETINVIERGKGEPFAVIIRRKNYDNIIFYECGINAEVITQFIDLIKQRG